jgi:hypothetical protein
MFRTIQFLNHWPTDRPISQRNRMPDGSNRLFHRPFSVFSDLISLTAPNLPVYPRYPNRFRSRHIEIPAQRDTSNNQVFAILLGDAVQASSHGTSNSKSYTHYSQMATVENNWSLGNLGLNDTTATPLF